MTEIITDIEQLKQPANPVKFLVETGIDEEVKKTTLETIAKLEAELEANSDLKIIAAPQLGIDARIFCIKFNEVIKTFINPIITKKGAYAIGPELFASMPGKEILIARPDEVTAVYYTKEFKYEENKFLGAAARIFDQYCQLLDGILPDELGLISDIEEDGKLADLTEEDFNQVIEIYKQFIAAKSNNAAKEIEENSELASSFRTMKFSETVINGKAAIVAGQGGPEIERKAQCTAAMSLKKAEQYNKAANRAQLNSFLNKKGK